MLKVVMLRRSLRVRGGNVRFKDVPVASVNEDEAQALIEALDTYQPVNDPAEYIISDLPHWDSSEDYVAEIQKQKDEEQEVVREKVLKKLSVAEREVLGLNAELETVEA